MRRTITLDPDVAELVTASMRERGVSFKTAVNDAIRAGLTRGRAPGRFRTPTYSMGEPLVPVTRALELAADLEDEDWIASCRPGGLDA